MRRFPILLSTLIATAACTPSPADGPASAAGAEPRQCFWASQVTGFSDDGPDRALVSIGSRDMWALELSPGCPDVDYAMRIGIVSRGSNRICSGVDAELLVPTASGQGMQRCLVRSVTKLSPEEAAAARGRSPKK
jgi:hypothetical protein